MPAALFAILSSAMNAALAFLVRSIIVKFVTFFALYFVVKEFFDVLVTLLPSSGIYLTQAFSALPTGVWYFMDLLGVTTAVPAMLSAHVLSFMIRRIPVIG
ncbi:DUF2523 domain-containing protein [Chromobacterium sp. ATCC 53434]|uniref:DUF2523 family protein n=1 Tax=Chromobacterium sp. (strain ATCC 53434 / SC 14030) TaxID=2059672 RepID=UPI000C76994E|nr:DUF2523 family protein [Chromobacterium sp. ATCC 53434]AUH51045.1 DUF2523 domain-containing protein [Chromobacterium sp. ATCC 53434]